MAYPLHRGWRVAGSWLPALTAVAADSLAVFMAVLALFAGAHGEELPNSVVLDFTATWCGPCQEMSPIVRRLEQQGYPIRKVDVDQQPKLAQSFRVTSIPTFVLVINGEERTRVTGRVSEDQLRKMAHQAAQAGTKARAEAEPPKKSVPIPETPKGNAAPPFEPEANPVAGIGEPKAAPDIAPAGSEPDKPRRLFPKPKFPKLFPKHDKIADRDADGSFVARGQENDEVQPDDVANRPLGASVRIRVSDETGANFGSGTIIDSRVGRTSIVTCGHIFRPHAPNGKPAAAPKTVEVDIFLPGGKHVTYPAKILDFDLDGDVGVITINTAGTLPMIPVAPLNEAAAVDAPLASIGCGGGEQPTQEDVRVTAVNRYDGPENIECTGVPIQGRSGGGLFDAHGQLVGLCIGADQKGRRGVYAGLRPVYDLLTRAGLKLLLPPSSSPADESVEPAVEPAAELADRKPSQQARQAEESMPEDAFGTMDPELFADTTAPTTTELAEMFQGSPDAEIICIVRPKNGGAGKVVILNQPSTKFVSYLLDSVDGHRQTQNASLRVEDPEGRLDGEWEADDEAGVPKAAAQDAPAAPPQKSKSASGRSSSRRSRFGSRSAE